MEHDETMNVTRLLFLGGGDRYALIDEEDWELVKDYKWYALKSKGQTYATSHTRKDDGTRTSVRLHRIITQNQWRVVDHIDGNGLNCRRSNLREATVAQNNRNVCVRKDNKSGYKGVNLHKASRKWMARIQVDGKKQRYLGLFNDPIEAAHAYDKAARELFGEYGRYNFPMAGELPAKVV